MKTTKRTETMTKQQENKVERKLTEKKQQQR